MQQENFSEAKLQIDSIKVLYPKAFEARKQGIKLMQQVDLKEQGKTLVYLDSMISPVSVTELQAVDGGYRPVYKFNGAQYTVDDVMSRWHMQLGIRVIF